MDHPTYGRCTSTTEMTMEYKGSTIKTNTNKYNGVVVVVQDDGETIKMFVNGVLQSSVPKENQILNREE
jgi:hypothetical protein